VTRAEAAGTFPVCTLDFLLNIFEGDYENKFVDRYNSLAPVFLR
jgi:hypothetical protein